MINADASPLLCRSAQVQACCCLSLTPTHLHPMPRDFKSRHTKLQGAGPLCLPTELIDIILLNVLDPADLLALALTCKTLHTIICPDYLHFRALHIRNDDWPTLRTVTRSPRLAGNIQYLSIADDWAYAPTRKGYYTPPRWIKSYWDSSLLETAAQCLPSLRELHLWVVRLGEYEGFLTTLRKHSPHLTKMCLDLVWNYENPEMGADEDWVGYGPKCAGADLSEEITVIEKLGGYTHFEWRYLHQNDEDGALISALGRMLTANCPALHTLLIDVYTQYDNLAPLCAPFWAMRLPHLRSLDLRFVRPMDNTGAFFNAHPLLERISMQSCDGMYGHLPPIWITEAALPNLREINLETFRNPDLLLTLLRPLPDGRRRPLSTVSYLNGDVINAYNVKELCENISVLRTLTKLHWRVCENNMAMFAFVTRAVSSVDSLELDIARDEVLRTPIFMSAISGFRSLKNLTFKHPITMPDYEWEQLIRQIAHVCPGLRNIGGWVERKGFWIKPMGEYNGNGEMRESVFY